MFSKDNYLGILLITFFLLFSQQSFAAAVNLTAPTILGGLDLSQEQLKSIKEAVEKAMSGNVDAEFQCGEVKLDCVARAARQWTYEGNTFREIVVNIHTVGHASFTVEKPKGQAWPTIVTKNSAKK